MKTEFLYKETSLYVNDLEAAERFYRNIIGLEVSRRVKDQYTLFQRADSTLVLHQSRVRSNAHEDASSGVHELGQVTLGISPPDSSSWRKHLQRHDVAIDEEITWPNGAQSIIFRDPAGNRIKLKTQIGAFQETAKEEHLQKVSSGGFNSKWKIYHAAKLGEN